MTDWTRLVDGMEDPFDEKDPLVRQRRQAIADLLRLMDCRHPRNIECEHVEVISRLGNALFATAADTLIDAIRTLPRPLRFQDIAALRDQMKTATLLSTDTRPRG